MRTNVHLHVEITVRATARASRPDLTAGRAIIDTSGNLDGVGAVFDSASLRRTQHTIPR